jgi:hypothetical protein
LPGDTGKQAAFKARSQNRIALKNEEIGRRGFGEMAVYVLEDGVVGTGLAG